MFNPSRRGAAALVALAASVRVGPVHADGDPMRGARAARACIACHSFTPGRQMTGPSLSGVWGRKAGTAPGFTRYSDALAHSGVTWDEPHLVFIRDHLDRITSGELRKLMLFVPPRHGKSQLVTIRYPAWTLERRPHKRVVIGSYNATLAESFSRATRRICSAGTPQTGAIASGA